MSIALESSLVAFAKTGFQPHICIGSVLLVTTLLLLLLLSLVKSLGYLAQTSFSFLSTSCPERLEIYLLDVYRYGADVPLFPLPARINYTSQVLFNIFSNGDIKHFLNVVNS